MVVYLLTKSSMTVSFLAGYTLYIHHYTILSVWEFVIEKTNGIPLDLAIL